MRSANHLTGRLVALLASILIVGTATAADVVPQDTALAMMSPATNSALQQPVATPDLVTDEIAFEVALPTPSVSGMGQAIGTDSLDELRGGDDVDNNVNID